MIITEDITLEDRSLADKYFSELGEIQRPMAASFESLLYCGDLIRRNNLSSILDAGSGISSVYFHAKFDHVLTVDDSAEWASTTRSFISRNMYKDITIGPVTSVEERKFDLVFYDYGNMETRIYYFLKALNMCSRFFYIDDMHISYYRDYVHSKCRKLNFRFLPETEDKYGRYGALIQR
jgi:predicted O-methyltransferase YrrM